jgi:opacity protein-like surface antigen
MKSKLIIFLLIALPLLSNGQTSWNVKTGVTVNNFIFSGNPDSYVKQFKDGYENLVGFHIALGAQIPIADRLSFKPELQFITRGGTQSSYPSGGEEKYKLNYLDLPLLVSLGWKKISVDFGPSVGLLLSSKVKSDSGSGDADYLFKDSFDFGLSAGVNFDITEKLQIVGRYYKGLAEVAKLVLADNNNNKSEIVYQNSTIQIGLSYKLK